MSNNSDQGFQNQLERIFNGTEQMVERGLGNLKSKSRYNKRDLELALTVLLVDLASADQTFDPKEYQIISYGLRRVFGTATHEVQSLVNQATLVLKNLRGVSSFASLLRQSLPDSQRIAIMQVIDEVIRADGEQDGFEIYLRNKLSGLLGVNIGPAGH